MSMYDAYCIKRGFKLTLIGLGLLILAIVAFARAMILGTGPAGAVCFGTSVVLLFGAKGAYSEGLRLHRFR